MPECRSCHAPVVWVQVKRRDGSLGARMMVDADPDTGEPLLQLGNVLHVGHHTDEQGRRSPMVRVEAQTSRERWVAHFATCPNADRHRRPR